MITSEKLTIEEQKKSTISQLEDLIERIKHEDFEGIIITINRKMKKTNSFGYKNILEDHITAINFNKDMLRDFMMRNNLI